MPLREGDIVGGTLLKRVGRLGFKIVFIKDDGREGVNGNTMQLRTQLFDVYGRKFEAISKGFEGGSVNSSLLVGGQDNKWLNLPDSSGDSTNEWGVFIYFPLCGCLWEMVVPVCEFDVVRFNVGIGLCGK